MRFKGLDLNLLVAFDVLLETRSTSRTAERLNLSQPAASAALGRLRAFFGDEILVAHGKRMLPTSYAESLRPHVAECLRSAETLIATTATFDPATSQRRFFVTASDYVIAAVLTPLIRRLAEVAPGISLEFSLPDERANADLDEGRLDLLITPEDFVANGHPTEFLFDDDHVVVGCAANPLLATPISIDAFFAAGHVGVSIARPRQLAYAGERIEAMGRHCRIELLLPSFSLIPWQVIGTDRIAIMHERLARLMAGILPIAIQRLPVRIPRIRELAQFHHARAADDGLRWLRHEIRVASAEPAITMVNRKRSKQQVRQI